MKQSGTGAATGRGLVLGTLTLLLLLIPLGAFAAPAPAPTAVEPIFILPFADPPGPGTWLLGQPYGNTTSAYFQRYRTYAAGQGIHFGVDLSARCGTEVVAIGDGVVSAVDNLNYGSAPHNLMIDHPESGYASFYGHLLQRPSLVVGQPVRAGQVVALSGDDDGSCTGGGPHLHLEIRDLRYVRKYNPHILIRADWDSLALIGNSNRRFQRDLDDPRRWQHLDDQPEVIIGGPLLNNFANPWPADRN